VGVGHIKTHKSRREELTCQASGPGFQKAMIHMTIVGITEDEPDDKRN
jgi:hypothetical protein